MDYAICIIALVHSVSARLILVQNGGFEAADNYPVPDNTNLMEHLAKWKKWNADTLSGPYWGRGLINSLRGTSINDPLLSDGVPQGIQCSFVGTTQANKGIAEFGIFQTLSENVTANTHYILHASIANPANNTWSNFSTTPGFVGLDGFPGYRVQLLAGDQVLAEDDNSIVIEEGHWENSNVSVIIQTGNPHIGKALAVRLVNKNMPNYPDYGHVFFDDIVLQSIPSTQNPTNSPTLYPVSDPTVSPFTAHPARNPTISPTLNPLQNPTASPITAHPTEHPTTSPTSTTAHPTTHPTHLQIIAKPVQNPTHLSTIALFVDIMVDDLQTSQGKTFTSESEINTDLNPSHTIDILSKYLLIIVSLLCAVVCMVTMLWYKEHKKRIMETQIVSVASVDSIITKCNDDVQNVVIADDISENGDLCEVRRATNESQMTEEGVIYRKTNDTNDTNAINVEAMMRGSAKRTIGNESHSKEMKYDEGDQDPGLSDNDEDDSYDIWGDSNESNSVDKEGSTKGTGMELIQ